MGTVPKLLQVLDWNGPYTSFKAAVLIAVDDFSKLLLVFKLIIELLAIKRTERFC